MGLPSRPRQCGHGMALWLPPCYWHWQSGRSTYDNGVIRKLGARASEHGNFQFLRGQGCTLTLTRAPLPTGALRGSAECPNSYTLGDSFQLSLPFCSTPRTFSAREKTAIDDMCRRRADHLVKCLVVLCFGGDHCT